MSHASIVEGLTDDLIAIITGYSSKVIVLVNY